MTASADVKVALAVARTMRRRVGGLLDSLETVDRTIRSMNDLPAFLAIDPTRRLAAVLAQLDQPSATQVPNRSGGRSPGPAGRHVAAERPSLQPTPGPMLVPAELGAAAHAGAARAVAQTDPKPTRRPRLQRMDLATLRDRLRRDGAAAGTTVQAEGAPVVEDAPVRRESVTPDMPMPFRGSANDPIEDGWIDGASQRPHVSDQQDGWRRRRPSSMTRATPEPTSQPDLTLPPATDGPAPAVSRNPVVARPIRPLHTTDRRVSGPHEGDTLVPYERGSQRIDPPSATSGSDRTASVPRVIDGATRVPSGSMRERIAHRLDDSATLLKEAAWRAGIDPA